MYVNLGYMHCFSTVHIVWVDALFLRIVYFRRLICCFMVIICVVELSGVMRAPSWSGSGDRGNVCFDSIDVVCIEYLCWLFQGIEGLSICFWWFPLNGEVSRFGRIYSNV